MNMMLRELFHFNVSWLMIDVLCYSLVIGYKYNFSDDKCYILKIWNFKVDVMVDNWLLTMIQVIGYNY